MYMYFLKSVCMYVFTTTASSCKRDGRRIAADHRRKQEPAGRSFFRFGNFVVNLKNMFQICLFLYITLIWTFAHVLDTFILVQLFQDIYRLYSMLKNWQRFLIFAAIQIFFWSWCRWLVFSRKLNACEEYAEANILADELRLSTIFSQQFQKKIDRRFRLDSENIF